MQALELADFRAAVARLYLGPADLAGFRAARDDLFATHPQSAIPRGRPFDGLKYYPPTDEYVAEVPLRDAPGHLSIDTGGEDGVCRYERVGILGTPWGELSLWWLSAYGGGLFLPVRDTTSGPETYGGGRYLTDTVKGTHGRGVEILGPSRVRLDFNYLYNPSCAYDDEWLCPLAPPENTLAQPIRAGELKYH
ncbi:hypothetical protein Asp14428_66760 [Actinoplanes sp. NBRC 14428]|uniref:DUF1684 domain-containing protein n=1 Tax=Pseudosporangium ferrugineum TaxID=439699 RepID=A0A2T0RNM4_9ACTN|nr:DUF1684 domain-containing protein [Pseudosporangium ferrugineum]PRY22795.1 hypothetical protein CLV70_11654 [Pseudosporangium ferrugineum]BCJ55201.1 hypothetical protein Asp14428_66760 [Actinoplanes sp. NBRC 14428]